MNKVAFEKFLLRSLEGINKNKKPKKKEDFLLEAEAKASGGEQKMH